MTKVKICGLSTPESVACAVHAGADYIGFVFAKSKRQVTLAQAHQLAKEIPSTIKKVGVFVSPSLAELQSAINQVPLDLVQIHGVFDPSFAEAITCPIIRAIAIEKGQNPQYQLGADYLLFDAPVAGSGQRFDWQSLNIAHLKQPFFIAGGLNVDNVASAIRYFHPYAVDVSTGVETDGQKDLDKIKRFIESVKQ